MVITVPVALINEQYRISRIALAPFDRVGLIRLTVISTFLKLKFPLPWEGHHFSEDLLEGPLVMHRIRFSNKIQKIISAETEKYHLPQSNYIEILYYLGLGYKILGMKGGE